jgi:hypothetical protein
MILSKGFSYIVFTMFRYIPSIPSLIRAFIMNGCWILLKAFSAYVRWSSNFCLCFFRYTVMFNDLHKSNHSYILVWNQLDYGVWSFWHVDFSLPVFYRGFLHLSSLKLLAYNSLSFGSLSSFRMSVILVS